MVVQRKFRQKSMTSTVVGQVAVRAVEPDLWKEQEQLVEKARILFCIECFYREIGLHTTFGKKEVFTRGISKPPGELTFFS
jgi:hypothetical protein